MFELLKPNKKEVGNRLKRVKAEFKVSFTTLGSRLGLKKSTISSYFQGYNLAPIEVIEKLSIITNKPIGWFYFGEIEDYILEYLKLKESSDFIENNPSIVNEIKEKFLESKLKGVESQNSFGYPSEDFIDNYLYENYRSSYED